MTMFQRPDSFGTAMPPDVFRVDRLSDSAGEEDVASVRSRYDADLRASMSARLGAWQYVRGALHCKIPGTALIIDPKVEGSFDLVIVLQKSSGDVEYLSRWWRPDSAPSLGVACESVVKVRYLRADMDEKFEPALRRLVDLGEHLRGVGKPTARTNAGDDGFMYALGSRVDQAGKAVVEYKNNGLAGDCLPSAVASMRYLGLFAFPSVLRHAQEQERELGAIALPCMEPKKPFPRVASFCNDIARVACTMDVSCDLANASHMDVNDAGPGFAVWTETFPGSAKNWYFVLPNVYGVDRRTEKTRQFAGVAIRLNHGVAVSWDGRQVRHCSTSVTDVGRHGNHVFGVFSAPKVRLVDYSFSKRDEVSPATTGDDGGVNMVVVEDNGTMLPAGDTMVVLGDGVDVLRHVPIPRKGRAPAGGDSGNLRSPPNGLIIKPAYRECPYGGKEPRFLNKVDEDAVEEDGNESLASWFSVESQERKSYGMRVVVEGEDCVGKCEASAAEVDEDAVEEDGNESLASWFSVESQERKSYGMPVVVNGEDCVGNKYEASAAVGVGWGGGVSWEEMLYTTRLKFLLTTPSGGDEATAVSELPLELKSSVTPTWAEDTALAALFASRRLKVIANRLMRWDTIEMRKFENVLNSYEGFVPSDGRVRTFLQLPVPELKWEWRFNVDQAVVLVGNLNRNLTFASGFHARLDRGEGMLRSRCFCPLSRVRSQQWLTYLSLTILIPLVSTFWIQRIAISERMELVSSLVAN